MSWNNGYERRKFEAWQKKQAEEYRALGMSEEQIQAIYAFDLEQFNSERRYRMHTQPIHVQEFEENDADESDNTLLNEFFDELTCNIETSGYKSRYWWIEEIENPKLAERIKILSKDDLELLTKSIIDEYTQTELADIYGIAQKNISKKLKRIKKFLSEGV